MNQQEQIKAYRDAIKILKEQGAGTVTRCEIKDIEMKIRLLEFGYDNAKKEIVTIIQEELMERYEEEEHTDMPIHLSDLKAVIKKVRDIGGRRNK